MAKSKKNNSNINQGGINISGNVNISGGKIAGRDIVEKNVTHINISFYPVREAIAGNDAIAPEVKEELTETVDQIEQEVQKGDQAEPSFIKQRLENIQKMAPDILEVMIATLQNPAAGISLVVKKVADKFQTDNG